MNQQRPGKNETVRLSDPWNEDTDRSDIRVRINIAKQGSGKYVRDVTTEWRGLDPTDQTAFALMEDDLAAVDKLVRTTMAEWYRLDSEELEEYFRQRDEQGYGSQQARAPYRRTG